MKTGYTWRTASRGALWYVSLVVLLPLLILALAGAVLLWREGWLLSALLLWLAFTLLGYAVYVYWPRLARWRRSAERTPQLVTADTDLPERLVERADWSSRDRRIWQECVTDIESILESNPRWDQLTALGFKVLSSVAARYHGSRSNATYRFTLPEILLVITVASERYRSLVMSHLPYADRISVGSVVSLVRRREQIRSGLTWANRARRVVRLSNPVAAVVGELRDHFTDRVLGQVSESVQTALKRLLLQEVAQAGIDLYSGRLRASQEEIARYRSLAHLADKERKPETREPLRVLVLGQVSAGKSSLINALAERFATEVDRLPTTDRLAVHQLDIGEGTFVHLVDTPGIERSEERLTMLCNAAAEADLLLWVVRATQPARAADTDLLERIDAHFATRPNRKRPPMVLVMSHADGLSPKAEWSPPYDPGASTGKGASMGAALRAVRSQLDIPPDTPAAAVCLSAARGLFNLDAVMAHVLAQADDALGAQWNRRRLERAAQTTGLGERWRQIVRLGHAAGRSLRRHRPNSSGGSGEDPSNKERE